MIFVGFFIASERFVFGGERETESAARGRSPGRGGFCWNNSFFLRRKNMMKILKSLSLVVAVAAVAGGATYALWSDKATISANVVKAGSFDLQVDSNLDPSVQDWTDSFVAPTQALAAFSNVAPGFEKEQVIDIKNVGTVDGTPTIRLEVTSNDENSITSAETALGDTNASGELPQNMRVAVYFKKNADAFGAAAQDWTLAQYAANPSQLSLGGVVLPAGEIGQVKLVVSVPSSAGNDIMTDSATMNIIIGLDQ